MGSFRCWVTRLVTDESVRGVGELHSIRVRRFATWCGIAWARGECDRLQSVQKRRFAPGPHPECLPVCSHSQSELSVTFICRLPRRRCLTDRAVNALLHSRAKQGESLLGWMWIRLAARSKIAFTVDAVCASAFVAVAFGVAAAALYRDWRVKWYLHWLAVIFAVVPVAVEALP